MTTSHHIQKLTLDLRVKSQEAGRELQESVGKTCRTELPQVLDEVFQRFAPNERIVLDKLELELPAYADEEAFHRSFLDDIRDHLQRRLAEERPPPSLTGGSDAWRAKRSGQDAGKVEEVMFYFLTNGSLPWNADDLPRDEFVSIFIDVLQTFSSVQRRLQRLLLDSAVARDRLVRQCKDLELARMLTTFERRRFSPAAVESTLTLFRFLTEVYRPIAAQPGKPTPRIRTWNLLIEAIAFSAVHSDASESVAFARAIGFAVRSVGEVLEDLHHTTTTTKQVQTLVEELQNVFEGVASEALRSRPELRPPLDRAASRLQEFGNEFRERRAALQRPAGIPKGMNTRPEDSLESKLVGPGEDNHEEKRAAAEPASPKPAIPWLPESPTEETTPLRKSGEEILHDDVFGRPIEEDPTQRVSLDRDASTASDHVFGAREQDDAQPPEPVADEAASADAMGRSSKLGGTGTSRDEPEESGDVRDKTEKLPSPEIGSQTQRLSVPYHVDPVQPGTKYYVDNAGLVLFGPYLRQFFESVGYLDTTRQFRDETVQTRAVFLMQYLMDEGEEVPEYKLLLNKLLCGYEPMEPIDLNFEISAEEKAEVEDLLSSVIQAWGSLRKTSIDGFRKSFLPRHGVLHFDGTAWQLQVERIGIDVLLDTVPWTYSIVKHPWMQSPIMVEW